MNTHTNTLQEQGQRADTAPAWLDAKNALDPLLPGGDGVFPGENSEAALSVSSFDALDPEIVREDLQAGSDVSTLVGIVHKLQVQLERLELLSRALDHAGGDGPEADRARLQAYSAALAVAAKDAFGATVSTLKNQLEPLRHDVHEIECALRLAGMGAGFKGKLRVYNAGVQDILQAYERRSPNLPVPLESEGHIRAAWSSVYIFSEPVRQDDVNARLGRFGDERCALVVTHTDGRVPAALRRDARGAKLRRQRERSRQAQAAAARAATPLPRQYIDALNAIAKPGGRNVVRVFSGMRVGHATATELEAGLNDPHASGAVIAGATIFNHYVAAAGRPDWNVKLNFSSVTPDNAITLAPTFDLKRTLEGDPGPMLMSLVGHYQSLPAHTLFLGWLDSSESPKPLPILLGVYTAAGDGSTDNQIVVAMGVHSLTVMCDLQGRSTYGDHIDNPHALVARMQAEATFELCGENRPFKTITYEPIGATERAQRLDGLEVRVHAVPRLGTATVRYLILTRAGKGGVVDPPAQVA